MNIRAENLMDVMLAERGELYPKQIRDVELEALVDTGATLLCLPAKVISDLGLTLLGTRGARTANGTVEPQVFQGERLTIMDRTCTVDVMELPEDVPPLVGYIPLENLDLQPDPKKQALIPNPEHDGKMVMDLY